MIPETQTNLISIIVGVSVAVVCVVAMVICVLGFKKKKSKLPKNNIPEKHIDNEDTEKHVPLKFDVTKAIAQLQQEQAQ